MVQFEAAYCMELCILNDKHIDDTIIGIFGHMLLGQCYSAAGVKLHESSSEMLTSFKYTTSYQ